jgi:hypothetical protein
MSQILKRHAYDDVTLPAIYWYAYVEVTDDKFLVILCLCV